MQGMHADEAYCRVEPSLPSWDYAPKLPRSSVLPSKVERIGRDERSALTVGGVHVC